MQSRHEENSLLKQKPNVYKSMLRGFNHETQVSEKFEFVTCSIPYQYMNFSKWISQVLYQPTHVNTNFGHQKLSVYVFQEFHQVEHRRERLCFASVESVL